MSKRKEPLNTGSFHRLVQKLVKIEIELACRPGDTEAVRARKKARQAYRDALEMALPSPPTHCISVPEFTAN
jgi:hypothetical protein